MTSSSDFIARTLAAAAGYLKDSVAGDRFALRNGWLQQTDPRSKMVAALALMVALLLTHDLRLLGGFYLVTLAAALTSRLPAAFFLKRTVLFIPFFTLLFTAPAITGWVTPGPALWKATWFGHEASITQPGVISASRLVLRVLDTVSLVALLGLTTRQHVLLASLRALKVSPLFIMVLGMTWRYLFVLMDLAQATHRAIRSRVGWVASGRVGRRLVAGGMGALWMKSYRLQGQVYDAMVSRGYDGDLKSRRGPGIGLRGALLMTASFAISGGLLWMKWSLN
jgi:cobalt/nickel transport system permease protein